MSQPDSSKLTNWYSLCRMWLLTLTYGYCFGVELTVNNIVNAYLVDQFGLELTIAGIVGSLFGLMNLFARSVGGFFSDLAGKRFGMRGRLWSLWMLQTIEGALSACERRHCLQHLRVPVRAAAAARWCRSFGRHACVLRYLTVANVTAAR